MQFGKSRPQSFSISCLDSWWKVAKIPLYFWLRKLRPLRTQSFELKEVKVQFKRRRRVKCFDFRWRRCIFSQCLKCRILKTSFCSRPLLTQCLELKKVNYQFQRWRRMKCFDFCSISIWPASWRIGHSILLKKYLPNRLNFQMGIS